MAAVCFCRPSPIWLWLDEPLWSSELGVSVLSASVEKLKRGWSGGGAALRLLGCLLYVAGGLSGVVHVDVCSAGLC